MGFRRRTPDAAGDLSPLRPLGRSPNCPAPCCQRRRLDRSHELGRLRPLAFPLHVELPRRSTGMEALCRRVNSGGFRDCDSHPHGFLGTVTRRRLRAGVLLGRPPHRGGRNPGRHGSGVSHRLGRLGDDRHCFTPGAGGSLGSYSTGCPRPVGVVGLAIRLHLARPTPRPEDRREGGRPGNNPRPGDGPNSRRLPGYEVSGRPGYTRIGRRRSSFGEPTSATGRKFSRD